jgi:ABC-type glycerol-3-phosphate transport system substrate-binding protein
MMKTKAMISVLSVLMAALIVGMGVAVATHGQPLEPISENQPGEMTTVQQNDVTSASGEESNQNLDANGYWKDDLDENLNFKGETVKVLCDDNPYAQEFDAEGVTGDLINDAIYNRNETVMSRLNVKLSYHPIDGRDDNAAFISAMNADVQSGAGEYDIVGTYSQIPAALAMSGSLVDLMSLDHLNFDQPWWPATMVEQASINNHLYLCTGDISTNLLWMMHVVFFNKDMIEELKLEDPYTLVDGMKWTVDKMFEMTKGVYEDLNGNGIADSSDRYGMTLYTQSLDANFASAGLVCIDKDAQGFFKLSDSLSGEKAINLLTKFCEWVHDTGDVIHDTSIGVRAVMGEGRSLFIEDRAFVAKDHLINQDAFGYGIMPAPAYDSEQAGYITNVGYPHNIYCISSGISMERMNRAAAVMECVASESYRKVTPALFETTMKIKYAEDEKTSEIYDLIKTNIDFDPARIYVKEFGGDLASLFKNCVIQNSTAWSSRISAVSKIATKKCETINATLGD